jgi:hypothetical protein
MRTDHLPGMSFSVSIIASPTLRSLRRSSMRKRPEKDGQRAREADTREAVAGRRATIRLASPTCAESGPFLDSTEIGASQIKGLRRTKHRFDDVVPTAAVDADQSS